MGRAPLLRMKLHSEAEYRLVDTELCATPSHLRDWAVDIVDAIAKTNDELELEMFPSSVARHSVWSETLQAEVPGKPEQLQQCDVFRWEGFKADSTSPITSPVDEPWHLAPGFYLASHEIWLMVPSHMTSSALSAMAVRFARLVDVHTSDMSNSRRTRELTLFHSSGGMEGAELVFSTVCAETSGGPRFVKTRSIEQLCFEQADADEAAASVWFDLRSSHPAAAETATTRAQKLASMSPRELDSRSSSRTPPSRSTSERRFGIL